VAGGDAAFAPVFDELNRRKAIVYFHPTAAPCCEGLIPDVEDAVVEFLFDTVRAVTSLLYSGTLSRCSDIRYIFSHAGSAVPLLAGRISRLARITEAVNPRLPNGAMHELKRLYYDIAQQASLEGLAPLMTLVSADQVLFGSDYPWAPPGMMPANRRRPGRVRLSARRTAGDRARQRASSVPSIRAAVR
jgi:predicted TIM-barrel fold metal-dependent hydrolase